MIGLQKVRDSNLAKTFQLEIGKEELLNEFIRQRERTGKSDDELEQYYRQLEEFDSGAVRETGDRIIDQSRAVTAESKSQQALQLQREENKLERKVISREMKEAKKQRQFELKQQKRKEKHRGR